MVKIERTPTPPASLAIESQKAHGIYNSEDVIFQLKQDFHSKCYLCELKNLTDIEVEHLLPHYNRRIKERVFDWNNLFYACPHCNSIKNNSIYDEKILDCCKVDPECLLDHIYQNGKVHVRAHDPSTQDETVLRTAELLENCFEKNNTGIRIVQCQERVNRLAEAMNALYKTLEALKKEPSSKRYLCALRGMISREYKFAGFIRYYVRSHLDEYPQLCGKISLE